MVDPHYKAHRLRLRKKLIEAKIGSLPDYEILELILCMALPRKDVKPLAKELIKKYGSLARTINTPGDTLIQNKGIGESTVAIFKAVLEASVRLIKEDITQRPIIESWKSLLDYARASMGHLNTEQFRILYLNKKNMVIADELQESGTIDHVAVYPREIMKKALYREAAAIILIHNHPSGNTRPSKADVELTKQIVQAALALDIKVHDHIIISSKEHYSFKAHGIM